MSKARTVPIWTRWKYPKYEIGLLASRVRVVFFRLVLASMSVLLQCVHPATDKAFTRSAKNNCSHVTVQSAKQVSYGGTAIEAANLLSGG